MLSISTSDEWRASHPGAAIGVLELSGVENTGSSAALNERKREVEARLRERFKGLTRQDLLALPVLSAYDRYYAHFNKTYHVQLQLESIIWKGKSLPDVSPAVDANFMAEVETLVLTAGHDVARLRGAISMDVAQTGDQITQMNGNSKALRAGDMIMRDAGGVCCSIIYGQDNRSPITRTTTGVLYVAYAPAGVPADVVARQLQSIEENVRLFTPDVAVEQRHVLTAA
jgi:DNA/RNA-binding domain of Phe-tRNA-synthetase-like protein